MPPPKDRPDIFRRIADGPPAGTPERIGAVVAGAVPAWRSAQRLLGSGRVHGCLVHIDIEGDQVVIQRDGTEHGMAPDLARAGIAPERIVLAFHHRGARPYSDFLAA
jgi:XisI protein